VAATIGTTGCRGPGFPAAAQPSPWGRAAPLPACSHRTVRDVLSHTAHRRPSRQQSASPASAHSAVGTARGRIRCRVLASCLAEDVDLRPVEVAAEEVEVIFGLCGTAPCRASCQAQQDLHRYLGCDVGGTRLPPQAARTEDPPRTQPRRSINRAKRIHSARPSQSPESASPRCTDVSSRAQVATA
jgi:hypothetical protein